MLADWVVGMLLEDFGITENDVVKMKHVNEACNRENHFNGGIISSDCESSSAEEETIFSLSRKITSILDSA